MDVSLPNSRTSSGVTNRYSQGPDVNSGNRRWVLKRNPVTVLCECPTYTLTRRRETLHQGLNRKRQNHPLWLRDVSVVHRDLNHVHRSRVRAPHGAYQSLLFALGPTRGGHPRGKTSFNRFLPFEQPLQTWGQVSKTETHPGSLNGKYILWVH